MYTAEQLTYIYIHIQKYIYTYIYMYVEKGEERYMFDGSFIVPTRFDFKVLAEYKNILSKIIFVWKNYNR